MTSSIFSPCVISLLTLPLQKQIIVDPLAFSEERFRPSLEERLESIISGAALMADSSCTRDDRRERIVAECNSVRQALQDLLSEYMGNVSVLPLHFFCVATTPHPALYRHQTALLIYFFYLPLPDSLTPDFKMHTYFISCFNIDIPNNYTLIFTSMIALIIVFI